MNLDTALAVETYYRGGIEIMAFFRFAHLPPTLQEHARPWAELAVRVCNTINPSAERTVALRKLLEGKDAAVRAALPRDPP
jgi:hypothetical protein